ncbi:Hpt domain-containing protein [Kitasatospora sp. MBT63]|uniref:Hpt domain-containing protein n=1 Tax=Kitasatospora sp. MBT63 TaxID=1444768 RepID=UPI00068D8E75|nr:Hpt domain-containing protein [Kitasatospora sp. MBT63]
MATPQPVIAPEAIRMLADALDTESAIDLVDAFLGELTTLVEEIQQGVRHADADSARRAAHTLKSNCRTFGLEQLASLCAELEMLATSGDVAQPRVGALARQILAYRPTARSALEEQRAALAAELGPPARGGA